MTISNPGSVWTDEHICLLAALAVAAFIAYGSLVPFDLTRPDALSPGTWLEQLQFTPWSRDSRTDLLVNVAVGVPLGFFLMGTWRSGRRWSYPGATAALLVVASVSAMLATAVELLQVLSPTRQSSWNDVLAQGFGAVVGALAWILAGAPFILWLRHLVNERETSRFAARLLQLYLPIYLLVQLTPFDTIRAAELAAKYGDGRTAVVPSEYALESTFLVLRHFAGTALLNVPIGALALLGWVRRGTRRPVWRAVLFGVLMAVAVGIAQVFIWWRGAGVSDLLAGTLGVVIGIAAATGWTRPGVRDAIGRSRPVHRWFLVAAGAWTLVLVGQNWHPFDFESEIVTRRLAGISLVPFASYYWYASYVVNPLQAVREALLEFLLAVPLGLLLVMAWPVAGDRSTRRFQGVVTTGAAAMVLLGIEIGQIFLPMRFPDITDVLIGASGAMVAVASGTALRHRAGT